MLPRWFQVFLALLAEAWSVRRDAHLQFLRLQIELLRHKLPGNRVILSPEDRLRLLRAGSALSHAVDDVLEIVAVKTYRRWIREQRVGKAPGQVGRPKSVSRWLRNLILRLARENIGWGVRRIVGELRKLAIFPSRSSVRRVLEALLSRCRVNPDEIERGSTFWTASASWVWTAPCDLLEFNFRLLDQRFDVCVPTFMTIAEDMSYNNGPMISRLTFEEFVAPYYRELMPRLQERGIPLFMDTDGDVALLVPWLQQFGVRGVLPLERQAGVDGLKLRQQFPDFLMIGHFDKMTMPCGDAAMRAEFERLVPLMKTGGFIPSVDHQTPPGVALEQYRCYLRLLEEFTQCL